MACWAWPGDTCKDIRGGKSLSQIRPIQLGFYLLIGDVWIEMNLLSHTLTQLNARNLPKRDENSLKTVSEQPVRELSCWTSPFHCTRYISTVWHIGKCNDFNM